MNSNCHELLVPGERTSQAVSFDEAFATLLESIGASEQGKLLALWRNWRVVLGDELADLGVPLGHTKTTLLIGAEDSMAMQDLSLCAPDILARVNGNMECEFFTDIRTTLLQGQRDLTQERPMPEVTMEEDFLLPPPPEKLGMLSGVMDPESPVARCYKAYLALYGIFQE